jgi:hypothetical protein
MANTRTSVKKTSRERARLKRAELDAECARRDAAIEDAAATFYDADDARADVLAQLDDIDQTRALAVAALVELKESNQRIAQLLDVPPAEVRRLRDLVDTATPVRPQSVSAATTVHAPAPQEHELDPTDTDADAA